MIKGIGLDENIWFALCNSSTLEYILIECNLPPNLLLTVVTVLPLYAEACDPIVASVGTEKDPVVLGYEAVPV